MKFELSGAHLPHCPVCGKYVSLKKDGTFRKHGFSTVRFIERDNRWYLWGLLSPACEGSGMNVGEAIKTKVVHTHTRNVFDDYAPKLDKDAVRSEHGIQAYRVMRPV